MFVVAHASGVMGLNRRQFLALSGVSSFFTVLGLHKVFTGTQAQPSVRPLPPTMPQPTANPLLRFVAIGDVGSGDRHQYGVANAMVRHHDHHPYNLVVMVGDNIYNNGEISKIKAVFEDPYRQLLQRNVQFRACLGNHDIRTDNGESQLRYRPFHMAGRYYTFHQSPVQFFVLDTNSNADWGAQLAWLDRELGQSQAAWKVVYGHHPIYSSGVYGSNPAMIRALTPLFQRHRVQLYLNGHEHDYERTHSIQGTTYVTTGHGGASLRSVGQSDWTAFSISRYGFTVVDVYADRLVIQGIDHDGYVFDRGLVVR